MRRCSPARPPGPCAGACTPTDESRRPARRRGSRCDGPRSRTLGLHGQDVHRQTRDIAVVERAPGGHRRPRLAFADDGEGAVWRRRATPDGAREVGGPPGEPLAAPASPIGVLSVTERAVPLEELATLCAYLDRAERRLAHAALAPTTRGGD